MPRPNALTAHTAAIVHSPIAATSRTSCGAARCADQDRLKESPKIATSDGYGGNDARHGEQDR